MTPAHRLILGAAAGLLYALFFLSAVALGWAARRNHDGGGAG